MGKGFYISKGVGIVGVILGAGAVATIIALSVVYSQEKAKNNEVKPTEPGTTTNPTATATTPTPSNETWDQYRLPKTLEPIHYDVTLRPHLKRDPVNGLYIFTGESTFHFKCVEDTDLILIHSNKLNYTTQANGHTATLTSVSGAEAPQIKNSFLWDVTQYLRKW